MDICFEGIGQVAATFQVEKKDADGVQPGMAVTLTGNGTVGLGNDNDMPCGVVLSGLRGGAAAVQIGGAVKVRYSGKAPDVGWQELACDGEGDVKIAGGDGLKCLVLAVDEDEETAVIKL